MGTAAACGGAAVVMYTMNQPAFEPEPEPPLIERDLHVCHPGCDDCTAERLCADADSRERRTFWLTELQLVTALYILLATLVCLLAR